MEGYSSVALHMPTRKQKRDGEINILRGDGKTIEMRGNYTREEILKAAIASGEMDQDEMNWWTQRYGEPKFDQGWYKMVPDGSGEFSFFTHWHSTPCRGSYFASCLQWH